MSNPDDPCEGWEETDEDADPTPDGEGQIRLAQAVIERAANNRPGFQPWYRRMPPAVRDELDSLRRSWRSGATGLQKRAMARAIVAELRSRDLPVSGIQGVEHWLDLDP